MSKKTWEEARQCYPHYADEETLKKFLALPLKGKTVPQAFRDYCQAALDEEELSENPLSGRTIRRNGHSAHFLEGSYRTVSVKDLQSQVGTFHGAHLLLAHLTEVRSNNLECVIL